MLFYNVLFHVKCCFTIYKKYTLYMYKGDVLYQGNTAEDVEARVEASLVINDREHAAAADAELIGATEATFLDGIAYLDRMYISRTGSDYAIVVDVIPRSVALSTTLNGINILRRYFSADVVETGRVLINNTCSLVVTLIDVYNNERAEHLDWRVRASKQ